MPRKNDLPVSDLVAMLNGASAAVSSRYATTDQMQTECHQAE